MARRVLLGLLALVALLGIASIVVWSWAEARMAQGFADWRTRMSERGWVVTAGAAARGGWPLAAELNVDNLRVTGGAAVVPGGAAYSAGRIVLRLGARDPGALRVLAMGPQSLRLGGSPTVPFFADRLTVTIPLSPSRPATSAGLEGSDVRFGGLAGGLTIGLIEAQADWSNAKATILRVSAEAIALPPDIPAALGPNIASATAEASFSGSMSPGATSAAEAVAGWRESGGVVALRRIAVGWGPLGVSGSGTMKLDADLQPDVTATLRLVGLEEAMDALAEAHVISQQAARTAKTVADLMLFAPDGDGAPGVQVPVTLREGTLSLGLIPIATLGKVNWPDRS